MTRVLVCGGLNYGDKAKVCAELDKLQPKLVIHGGAGGADQHAASWADTHTIPCMCFAAPWFGAGHAGGPIRNRWMLEFGRPDLILAFPGGRGTESMTALSRAAGLPVTEISP